jgi:hypothetical protein
MNDPFVEHAITRIADALERIAAADERRNELLVEDRDERREKWAEEQKLMGERWAQIEQMPASPPIEISKAGSNEWRDYAGDESLEAGRYLARAKARGGGTPGPTSEFFVTDSGAIAR